jgi:hypothetical protein
MTNAVAVLMVVTTQLVTNWTECSYVSVTAEYPQSLPATHYEEGKVERQTIGRFEHEGKRHAVVLKSEWMETLRRPYTKTEVKMYGVPMPIFGGRGVEAWPTNFINLPCVSNLLQGVTNQLPRVWTIPTGTFTNDPTPILR